MIEGTDSVLAQRALEALLDRLIPEDMRALNLEVIDGPATDDLARTVADSVAAMPFLAERRVVAVRGCERLRAQPRRDLWAVAEAVPAGNTLVLEDLFPPNKKTKPEPFGALAGRKALRIDTTRNGGYARALRARNARAPRRKGGAARDRGDGRERRGSRRDRQRSRKARARRNENHAGRPRARESVDRRSEGVALCGALVEGRAADALAIAFELFANDPRGAAVPLVSALATEFGLIWELARPGGGELPARHKWRERNLRRLARRIGERRARYGYTAAVRGFEAVVTGADRRSARDDRTAHRRHRRAKSRRRQRRTAAS